jgi:BASS family bile acid:Na+ symporter
VVRSCLRRGEIPATKSVTGWLLPIGLTVALLLALLVPALGTTVGSLAVGPLDWAGASVVLIFVISGYAIRPSGLARGGFVKSARDFAKPMGIVVVANLLIPPVVAWACLRLVELPPGLAMGVAVMAAVPTTLTTATVIGVFAGGNRTWSVGLTITSVCVGAFTAPLAFSAVLAADVEIPPLPLLLAVASIVIVPLAVGFVVARILRRDPPEWLFVLPPVAVIGVVWVTLSESHDELVGSSANQLVAIVAISLVGHLVLLLLGFGASRPFSTEHGRSVLFVVAQKTLPLALSLILAATVVAPELAEFASAAVLLSVVWHFVQLMVDSLIAGRMRSRDRAGEASPPRG